MCKNNSKIIQKYKSRKKNGRKKHRKKGGSERKIWRNSEEKVINK